MSAQHVPRFAEILIWLETSNAMMVQTQMEMGAHLHANLKLDIIVKIYPPFVMVFVGMESEQGQKDAMMELGLISLGVDLTVVQAYLAILVLVLLQMFALKHVGTQ